MFLFAALGILAAAVFEFILLQFHLQFHNVIFQYFLPLGGMADGALCAAGLYAFLRVKHMRLRKKYFAAGTVLALLGFGVIHMVDAAWAFAPGGSMPRNFLGDFTAIRLVSAGYRKFYWDIFGTAKSGLGQNLCLFILELAGFILGGLIIGFVAVEDRKCCSRCKELYSFEKIYAFQKENKAEEIKGMKTALGSELLLGNYIDHYRAGFDDHAPYYAVLLKYCHRCKRTYITYLYMEPRPGKKNKKEEWKGNWDKATEFRINRQTFDLIMRTRERITKRFNHA